MIISKQQSKHIQIFRGLAILAVVLIHNTPLGLSQVFLRPFFNFSVGLFLFFSGMLSNIKNYNPKKRIKKILIPYIIWTLIYVLIANINNLSLLPVDFLKKLVFGNSAAIMYYVFVYVQLTLLIPLIDRLAKSKFKFLGFLIAPLEIIIIRMIPEITGLYSLGGYINIIKDLSCLGWFTYYYLGYLIGNNLIVISKSYKKWIILLICSIFIQIGEAYWQLSMGIINCGTQMKLSSVLTGTFFAILSYNLIFLKKSYNNKILEILGNNSFAIYFSHIAVMWFLNLIPIYSKISFFPINAFIVIILDLILIYIGKKILGKYSKYLAL